MPHVSVLKEQSSSTFRDIHIKIQLQQHPSFPIQQPRSRYPSILELADLEPHDL